MSEDYHNPFSAVLLAYQEVTDAALVFRQAQDSLIAAQERLKDAAADAAILMQQQLENIVSRGSSE